MSKRTKIRNQLTVKKVSSTIVMMLALMVLVGANFFVFSPSSLKDASLTTTTKQKQEAPNPTEKESKTSPDLFNVQEEYTHEKNHIPDLAWLDIYNKHILSGASKLQLVPIDLDSPPPKL